MTLSPNAPPAAAPTDAEETVGGRPSGFFKVSGVVMPPGGSPATSAPEERYAMASTGGAWTIWDVAISPNGSGTLGAVCYSGDCSVPSSGGQLVKQVATAQGDVNVTFSSFSPGSVNPFWHNGKLDVGAYLALNHLPTPDFATIMLGDNDLSGAQTDSRADEDIGAMLPRLTKLVDALHAGGVGTVGLVLQPPPAYDQDAFGFNYGTTLHRLRMKRAMLKWWAAQIRLAADMDSRSSSVGRRVVIVPVGLNLDTQHNMARTQMAVNARNPAVTVTRTTNGVHPSMAGQGQIADAFFAWLKYESR
jgi:lysophospholipase L1-like esterase